MKTRFILATLSLTSTAAFCQALASADSIPTVDLQEVTVMASSVVHKADRDVYSPSKEARKISTDGLNLLHNMMIPTLNVNTVLETVSNPSGSVQLRINGRTATVQEVKALLPGSVSKVEYHENPGLRYGEVNAVLDFIVRNPTSGGSLMTNVMVWTKPFGNGNYNANLKLNNGKSQWSAYVNEQNRNKAKSYRDYTETFRYPDGKVIKRIEKPEDGYYDNNQFWGGASYNYLDPGKWNVYAGFDINWQTPNVMLFNGMITSEGPDAPAPFHLTQKTRTPFTVPALELYVERKLPGRQSLIFDLNASYTHKNSFSLYEEEYPGRTGLTSITTDIRDNNMSYSAEANYRKEWDRSVLTGGARWQGFRNRSEYVTSDNSVYHRREDRAYFYADYTQRIDRLSLNAGLGMQYSDVYMKETKRGTDSWIFRPRLSATLRLASSTLRLNYSRWSSSPSLSETNPVEQQIDNIQYVCGNPDLKPYAMWRMRLSYGLTLGEISSQLSAHYQEGSKVVTPVMSWQDDGRLVTTYDNSGNYRNWGINLSSGGMIVPGWLMAEGNVGFSRYYTSGSGYSHTLSAWSGDVSVVAMHWGFELAVQYSRQSDGLFGEKTERGEEFNMVMLNYGKNSWKAGIGMLMPVGRYNQDRKSLNKYYSTELTLRSHQIERMLVFSFSYNLQWGRQKRTAARLLEGSAESQSSSAASR